MYLRTLKMILAFGLLSSALLASPFTRLIVYGDSLSDNGNLPSPPYPPRFSNGPVAVELLADILDATLIDYAYGGATTGLGNSLDNGTVTSIDTLPGMRTLYDSTSSGLNPIGALFVVWGGPNDLLAPSPMDAFPNGVVGRAVDNLIYIVQDLQSKGAQHILVPGMPDLGLTPSFRGPGAAQATAIATGFNDLLQLRLAQLPGRATYFDTFGLLQTVVNNPASYGFSNVTSPCLAAMAVCTDPGYLFWDDFHVTTAGHEILARNFASAVPEPSAGVLVLGGVAVLAVMRRRAKPVVQ